MSFSASKDSEFGDSYYDISKMEKRLIRAILKTYEKTGTYVFLKLFKKVDDDYEFQQGLSMSTEEFDKLIKKAPKNRETFPISSQAESKLKTDGPSPAKKIENKLNVKVKVKTTLVQKSLHMISPGQKNSN